MRIWKKKNPSAKTISELCTRRIQSYPRLWRLIKACRFRGWWAWSKYSAETTHCSAVALPRKESQFNPSLLQRGINWSAKRGSGVSRLHTLALAMPSHSQGVCFLKDVSILFCLLLWCYKKHNRLCTAGSEVRLSAINVTFHLLLLYFSVFFNLHNRPQGYPLWESSVPKFINRGVLALSQTYLPTEILAATAQPHCTG